MRAYTPIQPSNSPDLGEINYFSLPLQSNRPSLPFIPYSIPERETPRPTKYHGITPYGEEQTPLAPSPFKDLTPRPRNHSLIQARSHSMFGVDPPRPPQDGYDTPRKSISSGRFWKWRSRSNKSTSETDTHDPHNSPSTSVSTPIRSNHLNIPPSPFLSESAHVLSLQHPWGSSTMRASSDHDSTCPSTQLESIRGSEAASTSLAASDTAMSVFDDPMPSPSSAARRLYNRAKRGVKAKTTPKSRKGSECIMVREMSLTVGRSDDDSGCPPVQSIMKTSTWLKDELHGSKIKKKFFGRAPWHHKDSVDSMSSVSSSVRDIIRDGTPPSTPRSDYRLSASAKLADSQFPGGEATRVSTPPLCEETADGRPRGFFTATTPPAVDGPGAALARSQAWANPRYTMYRRSLPSQPREWWEHMPQRHSRVDMAHEPHGAKAFQFDVPEHLPNSPMCPTNNRYFNNGTGVCVYHGRRRAETATLTRPQSGTVVEGRGFL
ncbi:hypothetical protein S40293_08521 [Stachybotrys chartarum IBT 40293]|nr:hypothetical protein S40293_08521 [Stachybotrys chartarum IBT 40293]